MATVDGSGCQSGLQSALNIGGRVGQGQPHTIGTLIGAIAGSAVSLGVQLLVFLILRLRLSRIYRPKSYLVPDRERVPPPPRGIYQWLLPIFTTSNLTVIQRCGLDAYFFLRFLRTLLKFFLPVSLIALPILLPINSYSEGGKEGLDALTMGNVADQYTSSRLWAHLIIAVAIVIWFCYLVYHELRGYIRVRQAYLTSPQHRIRASATTVLVTGIPRKWLTLEALSGLYDVFPGGVKNIWINRNFDKLTKKVNQRDSIAFKLEAAETRLIQLCRKNHEKAERAKAKKDGTMKSKGERKQAKVEENEAAERIAEGYGRSAGEQMEVSHQQEDVLHPANDGDGPVAEDHERRRHGNPFGLVNQGIGAVGHGFGVISKGVGAAGHKVVGDVDAEILRAGGGIDHAAERANAGMGFSTDEELYRLPVVDQANGSASHGSITSTPYEPHIAARTGPVGGEEPLQPHPFVSHAQPRYSHTPNEHQNFSTSDPVSNSNAADKVDRGAGRTSWQFWKDHDRGLRVPSPKPQQAEDDEFPLRGSLDLDQNPGNAKTNSEDEKDRTAKPADHAYPSAYSADRDEDQDGEARWRLYLEPKNRETMRLPALKSAWCPRLPFLGPKTDRIYWLRRELARLNMEIEHDQNNTHQFPFMTSAFVQFNHQIAAHMACQSVSHHVPQYMAPRLVEISPSDVLWDNMSVRWWERHLRTLVVLVVCVALIILFIPPVGFTSLLSNIAQLGQTYCWLSWLKEIPPVPTSLIQGILPAVLLSLIMLIVPIIFRILIKQQGVSTGNDQELGVQNWYFAFLFIVVFLVITLTKGVTSFLSDIAHNPVNIAPRLAQSLPGAVNYFYSYLLVQSLSNSAGALLQIFTLLQWFVFAPLGGSTPRSKWKQQTELITVEWGTFFPPFANFAVIGIIYSAIAPLILVFMLIIFSVFWVVYRYNIIYVYRFRHDTGGLLFPRAINQLFVGIYFLELCLIGLFFLSRDEHGNVSCIPQGAIMVVVMVFTILYHWQLNKTFKPLYRYLPITLEDEAVVRDEEFARAQASKFAPLQAQSSNTQDSEESNGADEKAEHSSATNFEGRHDLQNTKSPKAGSMCDEAGPPDHGVRGGVEHAQRTRWFADTRKTDRWRRAAPDALARLRNFGTDANADKAKPVTQSAKHDVEAQRTVGDILYSGFAEVLEDLSPEERDMLVRYSFQHSALRARRPAVWIPRDRLGVSDDEVHRAEKMSTVVTLDKNGQSRNKTYIWMSNEGTALDAKGRAVFRRSPPDFSNVDLIEF